jgi:hypothetical protein
MRRLLLVLCLSVATAGTAVAANASPQPGGSNVAASANPPGTTQPFSSATSRVPVTPTAIRPDRLRPSAAVTPDAAPSQRALSLISDYRGGTDTAPASTNPSSEASGSSPAAAESSSPTTAAASQKASSGTSSSPAAATPAAGVYRGAGGNGSTKIAAYKAFTKTSVPFALDFQATDTLDNLAFPSWMSDAWKSSGETMILGSTLALPGDWNRSFQGETWSWSDAASGALDATWKLEGQRLVAAGQADAVLRGNHEFNGSWFSWQVKNGEQAAFIQAWQRWVTVLRAVPGQRFGFDWNPTVGQMSLADPESAYPGDAYVTRIALDVYDGYYGPGFVPGQAQPSDAARAAVWDTLLNGPRGLVFWKNFANAHAKHMSFPEWGLENWADSDGKVHGGGDDAAFIQHMAAIFTDPSYHVDYQAFWEDPADGGRGVSDPDSGRAVPVPNSRAAYLKYIAGQ